MAAKGDKTEAPTAKKKKDMRKKGQVAKSQDLAPWFALLVGTYVLPATVGVVARSFGLESVGAVLFTAALVLLAAHEALTALAAPSSSASPLDGVSAGREE